MNLKHVKLFEEFVKESELDEALNELSLSSAGVKSFLRAMYTNVDAIKKLGFSSFKDLVAYIKTNDLQDWDELRAEVKELGILESKVGKTSDFPGKLKYNDQFRNGKSLAETLANELGMPINKKWGGASDFGFDNVNLYDTESGKTILYDALGGKYTFDDLKNTLQDFYNS
jgi:hypothetical protein